MSDYLQDLQFSALTARPELPDLDNDLGRAEGSDATIFLTSESDHSEVTESITTCSQDNLTETTGGTSATAVDDDDDGVDGVLFPVCGTLRGQGNQRLDNLLFSAEICTGKKLVVNGACANDSDGPTDRGIVDAAPGFTPTGEDDDPLAVELNQSIGQGRYDHKLKMSDTAQNSRMREAHDTKSNEDSSLLNASWKHPDESTLEATKVIQRAEGLDFLPGSDTSGHLPGVKEFSQSGPFATTAVDNLMPVEHFCATEDRLPLTGALWEASLSRCVSNTARQTQVHELNNAIHRLMPPDRIICFGVDAHSFTYSGVPNDVTKRIFSAAVRIAQVIKTQKLGIDFEHRPDSASNVFNIRYDSSLGPSTLAQAFFPSDSRETWKLCISKGLAFSQSGKNGLLDYIPNILAHEFMHILGLRHWNAGFDPGELREPSMLWPNTVARSRISVMNTGMHPNYVRFSEEDFRVIGEIYSFANGDFCAGRKIVDVDPYAGSSKL